MNKPSLGNVSCRVLAAVILGVSTLAMLPGQASADPEGYQIVFGNVVFTHNGNTWIIEASDGSIIRYDSFDIALHELVQFIQPSQFAKVFNYIDSASPTSIQGTLLANGIVYFVNPAGVIFGNNAVVNVAGIYAAAATIDNPADPTSYQQAMSSTEAVFDVSDGVVRNFGDINAVGAVHLIGRHVENHGRIHVEGGVLTMSAGNMVTITNPEPSNGAKVMVTIEMDNPVIGTGVVNADTGVIDAAGSQVVLAAGDLYSLAIRHGGSLQAGDLTMQVQASGEPPQNEEIQLDSDVAAEGTALFDGDVRIGTDAAGDGVVEIDAGDEAVFTSTVDSLAGQQNDLRVDAPLTRFEDNVGTLDALDNLQLTGDVLKSTAGNLSIVANTVEFNADDQGGTVDADQEARVDQGYLDIDADVLKSTRGDLTLEGTVGDAEGFEILLGGASTETTAGNLIMNGDVKFDGEVVPAGSNLPDQRATATGGFLDINGNVRKSTPGDLTLEGDNPGDFDIFLAGEFTETTAGNLIMNGDVNFDGEGPVAAGGDLPDQRATATGGYLDINGNVRKSTSGSLTLGGNASSGSDIRLQGETIETTDGDLIMDGSTDFDGPAGGTQTAEAGTTGGGTLIIKGDVTKSETGTLKLIGAAGIDVFGRVDGDFDLEIYSGGDAIFRGNIGELEALASFSTFVVFNPDTGEGVLIFAGDAFLIRVMGDITFNEELDFVPTVATIGATGDLTVSSANGSFAMGRRQKLTVDGHLVIGGGSDGSARLVRATLSDINTLGSLTINASRITILAREPGRVEALVGGETVFLSDQGVDFVAGGRFFFSVTPGVQFGGTQAVQFANPDGEGDALGTLRGFTMRAFGTAVTSEMLRTGRSELRLETFFDLRAQGPTNTNPAEALAGAAPLEPTEVNQDVILGANERRELFERLSVMARELEPEDLAPLASGLARWNDYRNATVIDPGLLLTVVARLQPYLANEALRLYRELLEAGQGNPRNIADALGYAYEDFARDWGSTVDPAQFGVYLAAAPNQAEARGYLEKLAQLHGFLATLGLTEAEQGRPMARLCGDFQPDNIWSCDEFRMAVESAVPAAPPAPGETPPADEWTGGDQDFSRSPQPSSITSIE